MALVSDEAGKNTAMLIENEKRMDTVAAQATIFGNNLKEAGLKIGETFLPAIKESLKTLNALFKVGELSREDRLHYEATGELPTLDQFRAYEEGASWDLLAPFLGGKSTAQFIDDVGVVIGAIDELSTAAGQRYLEWLRQSALDGDKNAESQLRQLAATEDLDASTRRRIESILRVVEEERYHAAATEWTTEQYKAYRGLLEETVSTIYTVEEATQAVTEAMNAQQDMIRAATDPIFALDQAMRGVEDANRNYDDAVRGVTTAQENLTAVQNDAEASAADLEAAQRALEDAERAVEDASWAVGRALIDLEVQALDGTISFSEFKNKLQEWVDKGRISASQADDIRNRVSSLVDTSNEYTGDYWARFIATGNAWERVAALRAAIRNLPRESTVRVRYESQLVGETGGYIPGRIGFRHAGGIIDRNSPGRAAWLRANERLTALEVGEEVLTRDDPRHTLNLNQMVAGAVTHTPAATTNTMTTTIAPIYHMAGTRQELAEARHQTRLLYRMIG
jgi:flagellin-like hook-associated protein FlgL